ncbi:MAG: NADH-quinone oxidoreductase subunit C, partial [Acetobacteraceae bacterium]
MVAHAARDALPGLLRTLRDDPRFAFEQLMELCGVDWPDRAERFDVVYCLLSVSRNRRLRVIVTTDAETPVPSVHGVYPCATWWEREAWDLFGIIFSGQPDLRRILT